MVLCSLLLCCCCWLREWFVVFSWGGKTCCPVSLEITYFRLHVPVTLLWCGSPYVGRVVKFPKIGQNIFFSTGCQFHSTIAQLQWNYPCLVSLEITYFCLYVPITLLWCDNPHVSRVGKFLNQDLKVSNTIKLVVDLLFFVKSERNAS